MGCKQLKIPTLWLLLSFAFEGTTSSCFSFRLLALPSLKELAITPADIYNYLLKGFQSKVQESCISTTRCFGRNSPVVLLENLVIIKHWSRELQRQNCTDFVWSLVSADPPSSIRIRGIASNDFWLWVTRLIADTFVTSKWVYYKSFIIGSMYIFIYLSHSGVYQRSDLWRGKVRIEA